MPKFRKKPVEIEAMQFHKDNTKECCQFLGRENILSCTPGERIEIKTLEGPLTARAGDYIIKGIKGEFYPCKPDIFEATYDQVNITS